MNKMTAIVTLICKLKTDAVCLNDDCHVERLQYHPKSQNNNAWRKITLGSGIFHGTVLGAKAAF